MVKAGQKWDEYYSRSKSEPIACITLKNHAHLLPPCGKALDIASGLGGNTLLMAGKGLDTHAWDISQIALDKLTSFAKERGLNITTQQRDVEQEPPLKTSFDIIVVSQFLYRPICSNLVAALKPGGLLFYQTWHTNKPTDSGPSNPSFLLLPNELPNLFKDLEMVFHYEEDGFVPVNPNLAGLACYIGIKQI